MKKSSWIRAAAKGLGVTFLLFVGVEFTAGLVHGVTGIPQPGMYGLFSANAAETVREETDLKGFRQIRSKGSLDVLVSVGEPDSVHLEVDEKLLDKLDLFVEDEVLHIGLKKNTTINGRWFSNTKKRIIVSVAELEAVALKGSGDIVVTGGKGDEFALDLTGSGDISMKDADYKSWQVSLVGSGDINLNTETAVCEDITIRLKGSGDVEARNLKCEEADVHLSGSGDIDVYASKRATAILRGSGDISIFGDPDIVDRQKKGSGDISVR